MKKVYLLCGVLLGVKNIFCADVCGLGIDYGGPTIRGRWGTLTLMDLNRASEHVPYTRVVSLQGELQNSLPASEPSGAFGLDPTPAPHGNVENTSREYE